MSGNFRQAVFSHPTSPSGSNCVDGTERNSVKPRERSGGIYVMVCAVVVCDL